MFDPRRAQLANKRKGDGQEIDGQDHKRRKNENDGGAAAFAAAAKAGQLQRIREAEQSSKRRSLVLPTPQVSESELEDIVKMGLSGARANAVAENGDNDATRALVSNYSNTIGATPIRTPRAPQEEDRIANELRNARARTETKSALLGGDNTELVDEGATTGYGGMAPSKQTTSTPNPMATPFRKGTGAVGLPGATPLRTPRDSFRLNQDDGYIQLVGQTPRDIRLQEQASRLSLRGKLATLPKPQQTDFELEALPEEQDEVIASADLGRAEDAAARDKRTAQIAEAAALADFRRQTKVVQRGLPRPSVVDLEALLRAASTIQDWGRRQIAEEAARLMANDAAQFGNAKVKSASRTLPTLAEGVLARAQDEIILEMGTSADRESFGRAFEAEWQRAHVNSILHGLAGYAEDELDEQQLFTETFDGIQQTIGQLSARGNGLEKKLAKLHGGYLDRQRKLRAKIAEASEALSKMTVEVEVGRQAYVAEQATAAERLEKLRDEVALIRRREREAQEVYRSRKDELDALHGA
jgi:pre-mRNA-splicing factor CDC5/CEF1